MIPKISEQQIATLVEDVNVNGFGVLTNYILPIDLWRMQAFVDAAIETSQNEYIAFSGPEAVFGSGLDELSRAPEFQYLIKRIYEHATGKTAPDEDIHQVLRCLSGNSGLRNSLIFHYDSYIVTALIPIRIPQSGKAGDLLMYPNTRTIRPAYILNVLDKVVLDNPVSQIVLRAAVDSKLLSPKRIPMSPGNIYFFSGYRSVHANEPCDPDKVRATAIFHYANPHRKGEVMSYPSESKLRHP
jgi:hypothetical protein